MTHKNTLREKLSCEDSAPAESDIAVAEHAEISEREAALRELYDRLVRPQQADRSFYTKDSEDWANLINVRYVPTFEGPDVLTWLDVLALLERSFAAGQHFEHAALKGFKQ